MSRGIKRRELFKFTAGTLAAATVARAQGPHKFFTAEEFAMLDELTEIIIPADEKSPGAKAAKVAAFLDAEAAEAFDEGVRTAARAGLEEVERLSQKLNGTTFLQATPSRRAAVVEHMAKNEHKPGTPEEKFFVHLKGATIRAYYTSSIGIHQDMDYKGNVLQAGTYAGELPPGPALGGTK
jgi:hypothetical protein